MEATSGRTSGEVKDEASQDSTRRRSDVHTALTAILEVSPWYLLPHGVRSSRTIAYRDGRMKTVQTKDSVEQKG